MLLLWRVTLRPHVMFRLSLNLLPFVMLWPPRVGWVSPLKYSSCDKSYSISRKYSWTARKTRNDKKRSVKTTMTPKGLRLFSWNLKTKAIQVVMMLICRLTLVPFVMLCCCSGAWLSLNMLPFVTMLLCYHLWCYGPPRRLSLAS